MKKKPSWNGEITVVSFVDLFYVFSVFCLLCLCARLFICALWSHAGKGLTSWLSFVVSNCEFVTFPLVSRFRCGTWLYRFLIFALTFTDVGKSYPRLEFLTWQTCFLKPFWKIKFSQKFSNLQYHKVISELQGFCKAVSNLVSQTLYSEIIYDTIKSV